MIAGNLLTAGGGRATLITVENEDNDDDCPRRGSIILAGNVADMSRHVGDDTTCRSNFGQMGPCRRHKI
jgi:hypothetical protein